MKYLHENELHDGMSLQYSHYDFLMLYSLALVDGPVGLRADTKTELTEHHELILVPEVKEVNGLDDVTFQVLKGL